MDPNGLRLRTGQDQVGQARTGPGRQGRGRAKLSQGQQKYILFLACASSGKIQCPIYIYIGIAS